MPKATTSSELIRADFWRKSQYKSYEEAKAQGGVYGGETCGGYSAFADAMVNVKAAVSCMDHSAAKDDLMVHLTIDNVEQPEEFNIYDCY